MTASRKSRGDGGGAAVDTEDIPAADDVASREVLVPVGRAGQKADVGAVDLDEVPRRTRDVVLGLPDRVRPNLRAAAHPGVTQVSGEQTPTAFESREDAADHGHRDGKTLEAQEDDELVLAPARVLSAQLEDRLLEVLRPGRLTHVAWPAAALFEAARPVPGSTPEPVVERGAAETEVTGRQADAFSVRRVPPEHGKPPFRLARQRWVPSFACCLRQDAGQGRTARDDRTVRLHRDSVPSPPCHAFSCTACI